LADLWEQNRGVYGFAEWRLREHEYATISYRGEVLLAAALTDWSWHADPNTGARKKALIGDLLEPGDPVRDVLVEQVVPSVRNPIGYFDDDEWGVTDALAGRGTGGSRRGGQGWQSDPEKRSKVENAAQDRLMKQYVDDGYEVEDVRHDGPYDAVARRGEEVVYLEAKGTETDGGSVLVTSGEVKHAREHPGQCVMGLLSDIRFDEEGEVDPGSGTFRTLPFEPADEALASTAYRWRLPG